jgi:hypothetical protein
MKASFGTAAPPHDYRQSALNRFFRRRLWSIVSLASLLSMCSSCAAESVVTPATVGHWEGNAKIVVIWCRQPTLRVLVHIEPDGSVSGKVGDAVLAKGRLVRNRGWIGRKLNLKTDFLVTGALNGSIVDAEGIRRPRVNIPLNFTGTTFVGGLHTSGTPAGGGKSMILSASGLTLTRTEPSSEHQ